VGSGPNGLAAAITLAQAGLSVVIFESQNTTGGGMRSAELTLPGFIHDICSAIHPLGVASPFFQNLPLAKYGLEWIHPQSPLAHPFEDGTAAILERSIDATSLTLNQDAVAYKMLMEPLVSNWNKLAMDILAPLHVPYHPIQMAHFALRAVRSTTGLANSLFKNRNARALFAGLGGHSIMPLDWPLTAAFALVLGILGHAVGWPMPRGGSQKIANALTAYFQSLGGEVITGVNIESLTQLPPARVLLFDVTPKQLLRIVKDVFPSRYRRQLENYRYGPGVFKIDWALNHPIPWKATECARAGTVHIGGTLEEIRDSEREVWEGKHPEKPFILVAQQSLFDQTRAPEGKHTGWAYCHVPHGSAEDMTKQIEVQIERFAPGFGDCIIARNTRTATQIEKHNPNCMGGDINGGVQDIFQLFTRPVARLVPYSTPIKGIYICSSSTPPGGGVHGMCGYYAAHAALKKCFLI
jgi:phytoene dehydrogenase-like protein